MTTTLLQTKLTSDEWNSIEIPESAEEVEILTLIIKGFHNVNLIYNNAKSISSILKITSSEEMDNHLYMLYFKNDINKLIQKYKLSIPPITKSKKEIKKIDKMRILNMHSQLKEDTIKTFDHVILELITNTVEHKNNQYPTNASSTVKSMWMYYYYSLTILLGYHVEQCNRFIGDIAKYIIKLYEPDVDISKFINMSYDFVERNKYVFTYADKQLYEHQKELFTLCKRPEPKLILYTAPTGTGKTLSPLGLSEQFRVIFVCAARHVGLALAKAAVNVNKKIAFAFGCGSVEDVRLHYFAVKEAIRDKNNGRIRKVDNSVGDDVEIMICDIRSYLIAMNYMNAFNTVNRIITYWDEPTISLDYAEHPLHEIIHSNWSKNIIPNIVLSSATLPREHEIAQVLADFKEKFSSGQVHSIVSHDFKKSIPIINQGGYVELPHFMFGNNYDAVIECAQHCETYRTLMRYFDLKEIVRFIKYVSETKYCSTTDSEETTIYTSPRYAVDMYFSDLSQVTMTSLKEYYLTLLQNIRPECWTLLVENLTSTRKQVYASVVHITTSDAHTLTDGPTIFLVQDVDKIAKYALQIAKIPPVVMDDILKTIEYNTQLYEEIEDLEKKIKDIEGKLNDDGDDKDKKERKFSSNTRINPETERYIIRVEELKKMVKYTALHDLFVPNRFEHLRTWTSKKAVTNEFTSRVDDNYVEKIMLLNVDTCWKLLLLMGIGAITNHTDPKYTDVMKSLASQQKLYMIITSTDYIYGTNYQFCHGYIGKDLGEMTQEKAIQAMGRVGRNSIQQDYTIRVRDDAIIRKLFMTSALSVKPEVAAMNRLFVTDHD